MIRGEVWTAAGGLGYAGKPRPIVILQSDHFDATQSITICGFTTTMLDATLFRVPIVPSAANGLLLPCAVMVDKISTIPKRQLGQRIGSLARDDIIRINRAIIVFLGLAGS